MTNKPLSRVDLISQNGNDGLHYEVVEATCKKCGGTLTQKIYNYEVVFMGVDLEVDKEYYYCQACDADSTTKEQRERNKDALIVVKSGVLKSFGMM